MSIEKNKPISTEKSKDLESSEKNEKIQVEKLKKSQKNFEAAKMLKVFLKNTKGKKALQKKILGEAFKIKSKK